MVKIEIVKGHSAEYKAAFLQAVHDALVNSLQVPDSDRIQRLYEVEPELFARDAKKTDKFSIIEIALFPGRSAELKEKAIKEMYRLLGERLQIAPSDIFILINDPPLDNWGQRGEQVSKLGLRYKKG